MCTTPANHRKILRFRGCFAVLAMLLFTTAVTTAETGVLDVGDRNQVFIDGRFLESASDVRIVVCEPVKSHEKRLVVSRGHLSAGCKR